MRLALVMIWAFTSCSCLDNAVPVSDREAQDAWICHNPDKPDLHGKLCTNECFVRGDNNRYCWLFDPSMCEGATTPPLVGLCNGEVK